MEITDNELSERKPFPIKSIQPLQLKELTKIEKIKKDVMPSNPPLLPPPARTDEEWNARGQSASPPKDESISPQIIDSDKQAGNPLSMPKEDSFDISIPVISPIIPPIIPPKELINLNRY